MKRNLTKLAKELAADLLAGDRAGNTGTTILAYYEPRNGTPRRVVRVIWNAGDPYDAAKEAARQMPTDADAVLLTCAGWAAPQNDDDPQPNTPPSLHPNRQRVCLVVTHHLDTRETVSAIKFAAKRNIITDHGHAHGSLAEAVQQLGDAVAKARA